MDDDEMVKAVEGPVRENVSYLHHGGSEVMELDDGDGTMDDAFGKTRGTSAKLHHMGGEMTTSQSPPVDNTRGGCEV